MKEDAGRRMLLEATHEEEGGLSGNRPMVGSVPYVAMPLCPNRETKIHCRLAALAQPGLLYISRVQPWPPLAALPVLACPLQDKSQTSMHWPSVVVLAVLAICSSSVTANNSPSPTVQASNSPPNSSFVTTQGEQFFVDGAPFTFTGTNAYWLPMLNSTDAIRQTLQSMKDTNVTVVRVW